MIIKYRKVYSEKSDIICNDYFMLSVGLILYSVFAFAEKDFYGYHELFDMMKKVGEPIHVERVYFYLTTFISDYYVWRLLVWGIATYWLFLSLKRLEIDSETAGLILPAFIYYQFALTRGSLGFAILLFSIVLLFDESTKRRNVFVAAIGFIVSFFFHKSIPMFILVLPIAYWLPFKKKYFIFSLIVFPFLYKFVPSFLMFLLSNLALPQETVKFGLLYLAQENVSYNVNGIIRLIWSWSGFLLTIFLTGRYLIENKECTSPSILLLFKYGYLLVYIAFLFYGQDMGSPFYSRSLHASSFPLLLTTCYYFQNTERTIIDKVALFLLLSYTVLFNVVYYYLIW